MCISADDKQELEIMLDELINYLESEDFIDAEKGRNK